MSSINEFEDILINQLEDHLFKPDGKTPPNLAESIRYSLLAPGKRIRPRLVLACSRMLGVPESAAHCAAIALEMIHCFTLIHDDLPCMDNDDYRRGRLANHKKFNEAIALLAGDGLIGLAIDVLLEAEKYVSPLNLLAAVRRLSWAMGPRGVIGGQAEEMLLSKNSTIEDLRQMHEKKTGALFSAALLLPKDLAGVSSDKPEGTAIDVFAAELGLAFQVADDLEDAKDESNFPTNIVFYQSHKEACENTLARLQKACNGLDHHWGRKADPLLAIAEEVATKLRTFPATKSP